MLSITTKSFEALDTKQLYAILQLRSAVFVVEQDCVYQDIDGIDERSLHVIGYKNCQIVAYTRITRPTDGLKSASIGRVVVASGERGHGYGRDIMNASVQIIETELKHKEISISAQCYLHSFYCSLGFVAMGKEYLEDGIPHIKMIKPLE